MAKPDPLEMPGCTIRDVTDTTLDEWLALVLTPPDEVVFVRNMFPTDGHRDGFIKSLRERSDPEIKTVLRHFLISTGSNPMDMLHAKRLVADRRRAGERGPPDSEHDRRLLRHHASGGDYPVWEGIGWVLDLLPRHPRKALAVLDAFFSAHSQHLTDNYLSGLFDAMAIIRQRYIVDPKEGTTAEATISSLHWRELEVLCGVLFDHMGYAVTVTPRSGDKGLDVYATREEPANRERLVVQAKKYGPTSHIERDDLVHLIGVVDTQRATRGVLVTTGPVRKGAWEMRGDDGRIDIIDLPRLVQLLSEHCGADWSTRVDRLMSMMDHKPSDSEGS